MRAAAARRGTALPADASVKRRIASRENLHSVPDEFYGPLVCEALGMTAAELGLNHLTGQDTQLLETRHPPTPEDAFREVDQLWRADSHGYEPLVLSEPSQPGWSKASLRWLVLGQYTEAATLARAARMGISGAATPTLMAQFHAMEACALARTGDTRPCELALAEATKALEDRNSTGEPEWIAYFDEAELATEAAHCFRDVNSARQAVTHTENAMSSSHVRCDFFATIGPGGRAPTRRRSRRSMPRSPGRTRLGRTAQVRPLRELSPRVPSTPRQRRRHLKRASRRPQAVDSYRSKLGPLIAGRYP